MQYEHLTCLSVLILVKLRNRTGKPCVTNVTMLCLKKHANNSPVTFFTLKILPAVLLHELTIT